MGDKTDQTRESIQDCREEVINKICMRLISWGVEAEDAKNWMYVILEPYEITNKCTKLAELHEDRNEYLTKRFLIAKTVKGCSPRTIKNYGQQLKTILPRIGKTVDDITAEDIRYYLAIRQGRDHVTRVTADNELRILRTFFQYLSSEELIKKNRRQKLTGSNANESGKKP